ncbi:MAG: hypothetical protein R3F55_14340 [Alphaproteobacteria bacterium]
MPSDLAVGAAEAVPAQPGTPADFRDFLPARLKQILGTDELVALDEAARSWAAARGRRLPVDIRLSLPFARRGVFVNVLAGRERRGRDRLRRERTRRPLATVGNVIFMTMLVGLAYSGLIVGALAFSGIVE